MEHVRRLLGISIPSSQGTHAESETLLDLDSDEDPGRRQSARLKNQRQQHDDTQQATQTWGERDQGIRIQGRAGLTRCGGCDLLEARLECAKADSHDVQNAADEMINSLNEELDAAKSHIQKLKARHRQHKQAAITWIGNFRGMVMKLQRKLKESEQDNERLQDELRVAQEGAFRSMEKEQVTTIEDRKVRDELSKLEDRLRLWARTYAIDRDIVSVSASSKELNAIITALSGYCLQEHWSILRGRIPSLARKLRFLLMQATLAKEILHTMFTSPFFMFPSSRRFDNMPSQPQLDALYDTLLAGGSKERIHTWRSQLLTSMDKCYIESDSMTLVDAGLQGITNRLLANILEGPINVLFKPLTGEMEINCRRRTLQELIYEFGELAFRLWTQRTAISCAALSDDLVFSSSDCKMTAHRLHHLNEDDQRLKRHRIVLVTGPLIQAWGDENAENYDTSKVLAQATVCVEE